MKRFTFLIGILLTKFSLFAQPSITSFTPASGPIGTVVTITGTNFNTTAASNIVFFGAVRAIVSVASATSLTVTVPVGTTYDPITITTLNNNLTAYSSQPFLVTFSGAGPVFTATSFSAHVDFATGIKPRGVSNIDLDNDNKPDLVSSNYNGNSISVLKNTSAINSLSYIPYVNYSAGLLTLDLFNGDIDGDGKPDIAAVNWNSNSVSVFRNTSITGIISFAPKVDFATGTAPQGIAIGDIDGDGKPDLVTTNVNSFDVSILRNTSTVGTISFTAAVNFPTGFNPYKVIICDLDGDGKSDLGIAINGANKMAIFRNTSTSGIISFAPRIDYITGNGPYWIAVGDLDGDGKPDLVTPNNQTTNLSVFRNASSPGVINFEPKVDFFTGTYPQHIAIGDLDGDGKPELALAGNDNSSSIVSVYKNTSSVGNISFLPKFDYATASGDYDVKLGDVDGDNKPDMIVSCWNVDKISILLNNTVSRSTAGTDYFRTITSGNWNAPATWESSNTADFSAGVVSPATLTPDVNAAKVEVRNGHTVTVTEKVTSKNVVCSPGSSLITNTGITLTIQ